MNANQLIDAVQRVAQLVELMPSPIATVVGAGLELVTEAIRVTMSTQDQDVAVAALLVGLRNRLRAETTAELQQALDASEK